MKAIKFILYVFWQWTWGFVQSLIGLFVFIRHFKCRHEWFHGALLTYHEGDWGGVSLGMFIFVNGKRNERQIADMKTHEYGHTVQSLILGPLYLFVIGIPSTIWCSGKKFIEMRKRNEATYYDFYPESWANTLGSRVTKEPLPDWEVDRIE